MTASLVAPSASPPRTLRVTAQLAVGALTAQVLVALTFGLIARELGRPTLGLVAVLMGIGAVAQDCADFGTSQWIFRELTAERITPRHAVGLLRARTMLVLFVGSVAVAIAVAAGASFAIALAVQVYVIGAVTNAGMYARLRARGLFRKVAVLVTCERTAWLAVTATVVALGPGSQTAAPVLVATMGLIYLGSTVFGPRDVAGPATAERHHLLAAYRSARSFGVMGLSSDLQQLDATLVAPLASLSVAADVGVASKLTGPLAVVAGSITQVAFRSVAVRGATSRSGARLGLRMAVGLGILVAAAAPVLPFLVVIVLGAQYKHAGSAVVVYALGAAVAMVNQLMSAVLSAGGNERLVSRIVLVSVVCGLGIGVVCAARLGAVGMGLGYVCTQCAIAILCYPHYVRQQSGPADGDPT